MGKSFIRNNLSRTVLFIFLSLINRLTSERLIRLENLAKKA